MRVPARLLVAAAALTAAAVPALAATGPAQAGSQTRAERAIAALRAHGTDAHVDAHQGLHATSTIVDRDGTAHVRMQRSYRGLDVVGGDLVVHQASSGAWRGLSQTLHQDLTLSTTPAVSQGSAEATASGSTLNRRIAGAEPESSQLVVDATGSTPRLAWAVTTGGTQPDGTPSRLVSYVDARTGGLLRSEQQIETADGSGQSLYAGTVPLQLTLSGSSYQLKDGTRGSTYTTDMNNKSDGFLCTALGYGCSAGTLFTSPDNLFGNGATTSRESAAVDAQYGTNMTWDFYKTTFGRNGIFGNGTGSYNRVHYGSNYVNAFWDGTKMTYGDGDGTSYGPLTSLDVAGHEMSHGVTENSANLSYSGESGGLNESTSDIFGTMVEFFANNPSDPGDYLIGEQFDKTHRGLRRMDNPASDGKSANCWSSSVGNLDVHYSSGVGNHFYYLLAEGSGQKTIGGVVHNSPTCNGSAVVGIGRADAEQIWYRALTVYMTSSTNYAGARTASLNAAKDLFGVGSNQYATVAAAWSAVSVG
ncbi:MAG: M4 family metallopeptidase [Marmoricola sp.]